MGNCCSAQKTIIIKKFAIKLPHGLEYLIYDDKSNNFFHYGNINLWIKNLYLSSNSTNWIVYNDDTHKLGNPHTTHGHSKGILSWSDDKIKLVMSFCSKLSKIF